MRAPSSADRTVTLSRLNSAAAILVVLASFIFPPGLFGFIAYTNVSADMEADTRVTAESVQQIISDMPGEWRDAPRGLDSIVTSWYRFDQPLGYERLRIIDTSGRTLSAIGAEPMSPLIVRSIVVTENGAPAATVVLERSLRPALVYIGILALIGLALAAGSYLTYYVVPLRTLRAHNAVLRKRDGELAFTHTMLRAATEGSLDAILIVDKDAQIVSYTQRFIDLWKVPIELVQSGEDAPVLAAVTAQTKDPSAFRARVEYLYAHRDEESRDRIETKDGRVLDRYTRPLHGADAGYLGRIWFFRDITDQEKAAAALRQSETRFKAIFDNARDGSRDSGRAAMGSHRSALRVQLGPALAARSESLCALCNEGPVGAGSPVSRDAGGATSRLRSAHAEE